MQLRKFDSLAEAEHRLPPSRRLLTTLLMNVEIVHFKLHNMNLKEAESQTTSRKASNIAQTEKTLFNVCPLLNNLPSHLDGH